MSAKEIWENLTTHQVDNRDVDAITHSRNKKDADGEWYEEEYQLHYYNWSKCWRELMNRYPDANYSFCTFEREGKLYDCMYYADSSASVHCQVTINNVTREMWLAVMDFKNKAVKNPSAVDIANTKMRCLVKCIAMFGLGLDIYEGNYDPDKPVRENAKDFAGKVDENGKAVFDVFSRDGTMMASFNDVNSWIKFVQENHKNYSPNHGGYVRKKENATVMAEMLDYISRLTDDRTGIAVSDEVKRKSIAAVESVFVAQNGKGA